MTTPLLRRAGAFLLAAGVGANAQALNLPDTPLALGGAVSPMVMLSLTKDHQLYYKAYNDYSDLDDDGVVDTSYKHRFDYYGYFDGDKCYGYAGGRFEPLPGVTRDAGGDRTYCSDSWHGNFLNWLTMSRMDVLRKLLYGGKRVVDTPTDTVLERAFIANDGHSWAKYYGATAAERAVLPGLTPFTGAQVAAGVSFCNTTSPPEGLASQAVDSASYPPLLRVAKGNYRLWAAHERAQCEWLEDRPDPASDNGNIPAVSGIDAGDRYPAQALAGLGAGDYAVRVRVCVADRLGGEACGRYQGGGYKPIGLMQRYGESGQIELGLMTGSYEKNISGGVLRKNIGPVDDEIAADGTFIANPANGGIIDTMDRLRLYGWYYTTAGENGYAPAAGDSCGYLGTELTEGRCTSWGNPVSEIYLESLRYFAGLGPTGQFDADDSGRIDGLATASWEDPLSADNYCAPLNTLVINASVSSYDHDQMDGLSDIGGDASAETRRVGDLEGITGGRYFVGRTAAETDEYCTSKTITDLSEASGLCPEAPTLDGSYLLAGAALYAHENRIRGDIPLPDGDRESLKVDTYGIALATSTPRIDIPVPGDGRSVTILPSYRLSRPDGRQGGGTLMDFQIVEPHSESGGVGTGKFYINWEDSEQGADHDMDVWGILEYRVTATEITVTTDVARETTREPQGFGYVISGTTQDGPHFHSGIEGFTFNDPTGVIACSVCEVGDAATSHTYTLDLDRVAKALQDPLFYAAKYGGYEDLDGDGAINTLDSSEWDGRDATGRAGSDGVPDNYYYVVNPGTLEESLARAFNDIVQGSSASSIAMTSSRLEVRTLAFQALFNSDGWHGDLLAIPAGADGGIDAAPVWNAAKALDAQNPAGRTVLTFSRGTGGGVPFTAAALRGGALGAAQAAALDFDGRGGERIDYLRGSRDDEGLTGDTFRLRNSVLGDIINSTPWYVGAPQADYPEGLGPSYRAFRNARRDRTPMLYVGANDGMLHGFRVGAVTAAGIDPAGGGEELLGYVPGAVYGNLAELTDQRYDHRFFVDSTPMLADAVVDGAWRTVLVGGLGKGGQAYYALDVTDPDGFATANPDDVVLWEFSDRDDPDLGYTFNQPHRNLFTGAARQIYRMNNDQWAVIVGNGYNNTEADDAGGCADGDPDTPCTVSATGEAVVYVLFIERGRDGWQSGDFVKLRTTSRAGIDTTVDANGMATPRPVDLDNDFRIDVIYAGDLQGSLWKFDVGDAVPANWPAFGERLFQADQPITTAPEITTNPFDEGAPGVAETLLVTFATGKFLEPADAGGPHAAQTIYTVWDRFNRLGAPTEVLPGELVTQTMTEQVAADGGLVRVTEPKPVFYRLSRPGDPTRLALTADPNAPLDTDRTHLGWSLQLPGSALSGEGVVYNPQLRYGRLLVPTLVPSSHPCGAGGSSWLLSLNFLNGGPVSGRPAFDVDGDGELTSADTFTVNDPNPSKPGGTLQVSASGVYLGDDFGIVAAPTALTIPEAPDALCLLLSSSAGERGCLETSETRGAVGRLSWRELVE